MLFSAGWDHANQPSGRRKSAGDAPGVLLIGGARPRTTFRTMLGQDGFDLIDAEDGQDGLELARKLRPRIILLELVMPGCDGWELLRKLKSAPETYLIPVVATSLTPQPAGTYHRARSAGFVDFVARPIERRHLLEIVSTWARPATHAVA